MYRAARLLPVLLAVAVLFGGCGDPKPEVAQNQTIGLRLDEYRIMPRAVTVHPGRVRLIMRNLGILPHNVVVTTTPEIGSEKPAEEIARTDTVHAGERAEKTFTIKPGTYRLVCTIGNHDDLGQVATLIVR